MPSQKERLTVGDYDTVILYLAECVVAHGERFAPFLDKMIACRDALVRRPDPIERARAIIAAAKANATPD